MSQKTIVFIIPTLYRSMDLTKSLLTSIAKAHHVTPTFTIHCFLWVNDFPAEKDESEFEREIIGKYPFVSRCLVSSVNLGFTGAVNNAIVAMRQLYTPDWCVVINNDTRVEEDYFKEATKYLKNVKVDAFSCRINRLDGSLESLGLTYYPTGLAFPCTDTTALKCNSLLCGTCMFLSGSIIESLMKRYGFVLHPLYFAYAEDLELSLRLRQINASIGCGENIRVTHLGSQTAIHGSQEQLYYSYRNLIFTIILHWTLGQILLRLPLILLGQLYIFAVCLRKGYVLLFPKIWVSILRRQQEILFLKNTYEKA
jgi:GT2 family glycosyltransferase